MTLYILEEADAYVLFEDGTEVSREPKTNIAMATAHDKATGQFTQGNAGLPNFGHKVGPKKSKQYSRHEAHRLTSHAYSVGKDTKTNHDDKAKAHEEAAEAHSQQIYKNSKEVSQIARGRHSDLAKKHTNIAKYYRSKIKGTAT